MRQTFLKFILVTAIAAGTLSLASLQKAEAAARQCRVMFAAEEVAVDLLKLKGDDKLNVKQAKWARVKAIFAEFGIDVYSKNLTESIAAAAEIIRDGSTEPSIDKSETMAKLGDKLIKAVESDFSKAQNLALGFHVAESVLKIERIKLDTFDTTKEEPSVFKAKGALHIKEFAKYVESYIDGTPLYANLGNEVGFITWPNIRHLYSNNSWGIGLRHHDMYHLHYAYGHPYYLAVNFMTSRTINDRRYMMVSSYWEAVDTNQTGFEGKMGGFFKSLNMSPQEGMIYLGRATKEMLDKVDAFRPNSGTALNEIGGFGVSYASGEWKPQLIKFGRTAFAKSHDVYDKELQDFINAALVNIANPEKTKYVNYHRQGPGHVSDVDDDTSKGY